MTDQQRRGLGEEGEQGLQVEICERINQPNVILGADLNQHQVRHIGALAMKLCVDGYMGLTTQGLDQVADAGLRIHPMRSRLRGPRRRAPRRYGGSSIRAI